MLIRTDEAGNDVAIGIGKDEGLEMATPLGALTVEEGRLTIG